MIEIPVEVGDGATRIRTAGRAESIRRAVEPARAYYHGASVWVMYPVDPEAFFVRDSTALAARLFGLEMPEKVTG